jgi:hypothetical protein
MTSGEIKGNNPYLLNRMSVDQSFKSSHCDLSTIVGYGADGQIISNGDNYNPFNPKAPQGPASYGYSGFQQVTKAQDSDGAPGTLAGSGASAGWSFITNPERKLRNELDELNSLTGKPSSKRTKSKYRHNEPEQEPDWRKAFSQSASSGENSLKKLTEERYRSILGGERSSRVA